MEKIFFIFMAYVAIKYLLFIILIARGKEKSFIEFIASLLIIAFLFLQINDFLISAAIVAIELILSNILLLVNVFVLKNIGFKIMISITHDGIVSRFLCIFFNKRRLYQRARRLQQIDYGPKLKHGLAGMVGKVHKGTKVKFDKRGFPIFKVYYTVKLKIGDYRKSREFHFYYANRKVYKKALKKKEVRKLFTKKELEELKKGITPDRYTWHHHQDRGKMQLVSRKIHSSVSHIGGYSIWGGEE